MKRIIALGAAAVLLASGAASAQQGLQIPESGAYLGGGVGRSWGPSGGDINGSFSGIPNTGTSVDHTDNAWGLHLGYRFSRNLAAELGYGDLGKFDYSTGTAAGPITGTYRAKAWSFAGLGLLPLGASPFSLYGKLGAAHVDVDRNVDSQPLGGTASSASANRTVPLVGFGLNYDISRNWYGRLGWDHYDRVGDGSTGKTDIDQVNIGVGWRF